MRGDTESIKPPTDPIAIIGMGCRVPGDVYTPAQLLEFLRRHGDGVAPIPASRWNSDSVYSTDVAIPGKSPIRHAALLSQPITDLDPAPFGLAPREAQQLDPQQRLLLETAWHALEDAGIPPPSLKGSSTGVFVGAFIMDSEILANTATLTATQEHFNPAAHGATMVSARLAYTFDLRGPTMSVDTACSSSLVATALAVDSLRARQCDMAIAGGGNAILSPTTVLTMAKGGFLAKDGRSKTFDADADGYGRGEGAGVVVLKRLEDAIRDGDGIYAVIAGAGTNSDGKTDTMPMPSQGAQAVLAAQVVKQADVDPAKVHFVECHGTGTGVGDPIELGALGKVYGRARGRPKGVNVLVTSIKSNVGHAEAASGSFGLIKASIMVQEREVLPLRALGKPNPAIKFNALGAEPVVSTRALPKTGDVYGAINSFGYGGSNAHILVASAPEGTRRHSLTSGWEVVPAGKDPRAGKPFVLPISGACDAGLKAMAKILADQMREFQGTDQQKANALACIRHTIFYKRTQLRERAAIMGTSFAHALAGLDLVAEGGNVTVENGTDTTWPVVVTGQQRKAGCVWVFTGMGPQSWAMGRHLYASEPAFAKGVDEVDALFKRMAGWSVKEVILKEEEGGTKMNTHKVAMPANFVIQVGLVYYLRSMGSSPCAIVGHSVGEVAAAWAAGCLTLREATKLLHGRNVVQQKLVGGGGGMLAVAVGVEEAQRHMEAVNTPVERVSVAAINAPDSTTLAGEVEALEEVRDKVKAGGGLATLLKVEVPYHSHMMKPYLAEIKKACATPFTFMFGGAGSAPRQGAPDVPFFSTTLGRRIVAQREVRNGDYWVQNAAQPVLLQSALTATMDSGNRDLFLEVGPHPVLRAAIMSIAGSLHVSGTQVLHCLRRGKPEHAMALAAIGQQYTCGNDLDWSKLAPQSGFIQLPFYPFQHPAQGPQRLIEGTDMEKSPLLPVMAPDSTTRTALIAHEESMAEGKEYWCDLRHIALDFLKQHRASGTPILPASAHIEAMVSAVAVNNVASTQAMAVLRNVQFMKPLQLLEDSHSTQTLSVKVDKLGDVGVFMTSAGGQVFPSMQYSRAHVVPDYDTKILPRVYDIAAARAALESEPVELDTEAFYEQFRAQGMDYGINFQRVKRAGVMGDRHIVEISTPEADEVVEVAPMNMAALNGLAKFNIHPGTLDCAFQAGTVQLTMDPTNLFLPAAVDQVILFKPIPEGVKSVYADVSADQSPTAVTMDITLVNPENGDVLMEVKEMMLKPVPRRQPEEMFMHEIWEKKEELIPKTLPEEPVNFRIIGEDSHPIVAALRARPDLWKEVEPPQAPWTDDPDAIMQGANDYWKEEEKVEEEGALAIKEGGLAPDAVPVAPISTLSTPTLGDSPDGTPRIEATENGGSDTESGGAKVGSKGESTSRPHSESDGSKEELEEAAPAGPKTEVFYIPDYGQGAEGDDPVGRQLQLEATAIARSVILRRNERMTLVGTNAFACTDYDIVEPRMTCIWGFIRSLRTEAPLLNIRLLDIVADAPAAVAEAAAAAAAVEKYNAEHGHVVAAAKAEEPAEPAQAVDEAEAADEAEGEEEVVEEPPKPVTLAEFALRSGQPEERAWRWGETYAANAKPGIVQAEPRVVHRLMKPDERFTATVGIPGQLRSVCYKLDPPPVETLPDGYVEIKVEYASLNWKDILKVTAAMVGEINMRHMGSGLALECSGEISRVGPGVTDLNVGDKVYAARSQYGLGCCSSHIVIERTAVVYRPILYDDGRVNASYVSAITAHHSISAMARLKKDERILIHSATGGVGSIAIKLAIATGAEVFATAGSEKKRQMLRDMGVKYVYDSRTLDFGWQIRRDIRKAGLEGGIDVVINSLPGEAMKVSLELLDREGRFIEIGMRDTYDESAALRLSNFQKGVTYGTVDLSMRNMRTQGNVTSAIRDFVEEMGDRAELLADIPYNIYPAHKLAEALELLSRGHHTGKLLIDVQSAYKTPIPIGVDMTTDAPFRPDRTYLVTGGTAAFGLWTARRLVQSGVKHLMLGSRRGVFADDESKEMAAQIRAQGCEITLVKMDVSKLEDVQAALSKIPSHLPLDGVFHAAAVMHDLGVDKVTHKDIDIVILPKAIGAYNLHVATMNMGINYFVHYGSLTGLMGHDQQLAYAGANMYLEGLVHYRRRIGLPGILTHFARIGDTGMAKRMVEEIGTNMQLYLEQNGILENTAGDMVDSMFQFIGMGPSVMRASLLGKIEWHKWVRRHGDLQWYRIAEMVKASQSGQGASKVSQARARLRALVDGLDDRGRLDVAMHEIKKVSADVLRIDVKTLNEATDLKSFGLDSLSLMEMKVQLENRVGLMVTPLEMMAASGQGLEFLALKLLDQVDGEEMIDEVVEEVVEEDANEAEYPTWQEMGPVELRKYVLARIADQPPYFRIQALSYDGEWFSTKLEVTARGQPTVPYSPDADVTKPLKLKPIGPLEEGIAPYTEIVRHALHVGQSALVMKLPVKEGKRFYPASIVEWNANGTVPRTEEYEGGLELRARVTDVNEHDQLGDTEGQLIGYSATGKVTVLQSGFVQFQTIPDFQFEAIFGEKREAGSGLSSGIDPYSSPEKMNVIKRELVGHKFRVTLGSFTKEDVPGHFPHFPSLPTLKLMTWGMDASRFSKGKVRIEKTSSDAYKMIWPGQALEIEIELQSVQNGRWQWESEVSADGEVVARAMSIFISDGGLADKLLEQRFKGLMRRARQ